MKKKKCTKCGEKYPSTKEYFVRDRSQKDGLYSSCKKCQGIKTVGQNTLTDKNRLSITNPELAKEWNYKRNYPLAPEDVRINDHRKKYWWTCKNKHQDQTCNYEWQATIPRRMKHKSECFNCTSLSVINPTLCKEWDYEKNYPLTPKDISYGSMKKAWWVCSICGEKWDAMIRNRNRGAGCPFHGEKPRRVSKKHCLAITHPTVIEEWDYEANILTPFDISSGMEKIVNWVCRECNATWRASIRYQCQKGHKCTKCNSLGILYPEVSKDWDFKANYPLTPFDVFYGTPKTYQWKCYKNPMHKWETSPMSKVNNYKRYSANGCPYCNNKKIDQGNCLATLYPEIAKDWDYKANHPLTPLDVAPRSDKKVWWKCHKKNCGHRVEIKIHKRVRNHGYCSKCNSLGTLYPEIAKELCLRKNHPSVFEITSKNNKICNWICHVCKTKWKATVANRTNGECNCPACNNIQLKTGEIFRSTCEAYFYLKLKKIGYDVLYDQCYNFRDKGIGKRRYDFYSQIDNLYIEVTSFDEKWKYWNEYLKNIEIKKQYVEQILQAKFLFVQFHLTTQDRIYVQKHRK